MAVINVYEQYFSAACNFNGVPRKGALVTLVSDSGSGYIRYEAAVSFFPHRDENDFVVSYDAYQSEELFSGPGRRSKKREALLLDSLREHIDAISLKLGGTVFWDAPLRDARRG